MHTVTAQNGRVITRNEFIDEWQKDLRSGKFKQTKGCLRYEEGYCCLGISCETGTRLGIKEAELEQDHGRFYNDGDAGLPGRWFCQLFNSHDPVVIINSYRTYLSTHNDDKNATFDDIATSLDQLRE